MNISVILPAAGTGSRTKLGYNKVLYEYNDNYLINHTLNKFLKLPEVKEIIVVYKKSDYYPMLEIILKHKKIKLVEGAPSRQQSVKNGFAAITKNPDYVYVHDTARPNISKNLLKKTISQLETNADCYCVAIKVVDTLRKVDENNNISQTIERENVVRMQTPQIAKYEVFKKCYENDEQEYTDEAGLFLANDYKIEWINGEEENFKVTTEDDLRRINELI